MTALEAGLVGLLVVLPLVSTVSAFVLVGAARQHPPISTLNERALVAVLTSAGGWIISFLAANRLLGWFDFGPPWSTLTVIVALLLFSAPAPVFLVLYTLGRLR